MAAAALAPRFLVCYSASKSNVSHHTRDRTTIDVDDERLQINYTKNARARENLRGARNVVSLGPAGAGGIQAQVGPLVVPLGAE